jgi:predicted DNA-binding ribbon-helix-helix protein
LDAVTVKPNPNRKRSIIIKKRRTSVSLEDIFWRSLNAIVRTRNITIGDFVEEVSRQHDTLNLSSALRVAVLEYYQRLAVDGAVIGGVVVTGRTRVEDTSSGRDQPQACGTSALRTPLNDASSGTLSPDDSAWLGGLALVPIRRTIEQSK